MRKPTYAMLILLVLGSTRGSAVAARARYLDSVFAAVATTPDIRYGSGLSAAGTAENLFLDVYQPVGDTLSARPLMIFAHGGGFSAGSKTDADMVFLCRTFAKKGYVTVSIAYRLQAALPTFQAMGTEVVRAVQDAKAAVRFLRAHRADYRIDDTRIMLGGTSAGGVVALEYAYRDADEIPVFIDTAVLGGMEGRGGTPEASSAINGIINCWGGVGDSAILADGKLPAISFHGTADATVPYDIGYALGNPALTLYGSACVHRSLTRAGARSVLKPFPGMGHGFVSLTDPRLDTLVSLAGGFAYEVLFGGGTGAVRSAAARGVKADGSGEARSLDGRLLEPGAFGKRYASPLYGRRKGLLRKAPERG